MNAETRNEGMMVSVCFYEPSPDAAGVELVRRTADRIAVAYRYWEVVVVAPPEPAGEEAFRRLSQETPNVRVLKVRGAPSVYRRRTIAASEAIGDVVVLTAAHEADGIDLLALVRAVVEENSAVVFTRDGRSPFTPLLDAIGAASGFRVSVQDLQTSAFPRTLLNRLLAHPERELALRFPPRDEGFPVRRMPLATSHQVGRGASDPWRRLGLLYRLLVNGAPAVLAGVALMSMLGIIAAILYAIYAVVVWLTLDHIAPGWFTTSIMLSTLGVVLGIALLGISLGLQKVLERLEPDLGDVIVEEYANVDLFRHMGDLNVDVAVGAQDGTRAP